MKILAIVSQGEGGGKKRVRYGATIRTFETATFTMRENAAALGHTIAKRADVPDSLVDKTYQTVGAARLAAEAKGFQTLTAQKLASLANKKAR